MTPKTETKTAKEFTKMVSPTKEGLRQQLKDAGFLKHVEDWMERYHSQFQSPLPASVPTEMPDVSDEAIEIRIAMSLFAATPEYKQGFETGGLNIGQWVRNLLLPLIEKKDKEIEVLVSEGERLELNWQKETGVLMQSLEQKDKEIEGLKSILVEDTAYPLSETLSLLITATDKLLHKYGYDGHDYEEMEAALKQAGKIKELYEIFKNESK